VADRRFALRSDGTQSTVDACGGRTVSLVSPWCAGEATRLTGFMLILPSEAVVTLILAFHRLNFSRGAGDAARLPRLGLHLSNGANGTRHGGVGWREETNGAGFALWTLFGISKLARDTVGADTLAEIGICSSIAYATDRTGPHGSVRTVHTGLAGRLSRRIVVITDITGVTGGRFAL
jgi:hypothetical protein